MLGRLEDDVAAATAVPAIGPAELDERLATHRHRPIAALSGPHEHLDLVYERLRLHLRKLYQKTRARRHAGPSIRIKRCDFSYSPYTRVVWEPTMPRIFLVL